LATKIAARSPNLLTGKLFNHNGVCFTNQRTCGKNKSNTYYYATKGFYLPAPQVDEVILETIAKFLHAVLNALSADSVHVIKHIDWQHMPYTQRREFIQSVVDKVIYTNEQLIINLNVRPDALRPFTSDTYINQSHEPMHFITNEYTVTITVSVVLRKYASTQFDKTSKTGLLTIADNNHLIVKAFATAWKYRGMYEQEMSSDDICRKEHISPRQFFRHLDLAYMHPNKVNSILSGERTIKVNDLFQIAKENQL